MREPKYLKWIFLSVTFGFVFLMIILPLSTVVSEALAEGFGAYLAALLERDVLSAAALTTLCALVAVPLNTIFGIFLAYAIAKFEFRGKAFLTALLDLPFAISPVVVGLSFVLLFGSHGFWGKFLEEHDIKIIFALPGILLACAFVTFPFVAKEILPLLQEEGNEAEEAALSLGASGWQSFWRVTLPSIRWGLFYGVILTNARAMGEFGAVAVVSGKIVGQTTTLPIYIEILYSEYTYVTAFAIASLLAMLAFVTLGLKILFEKMEKRNGY